MRHGIAEERDPDKLDHLRALTEEGIVELEENVGFLRLYLLDEKVQLISSPLARAVETARILSHAGLGDFEIQDFVAEGDIDGLKRRILREPDITHLIIGHSPFLEEWTMEMTDQHFDMKKGSACQIEITDEKASSGFLTWYLACSQFSRLIDFGSFRDQKEEFKQEIEAIVERYQGIILEHVKIYLNEPDEKESVHKLRIKIRQFRSLISLFKPLLKKKKYRAVQGALRGMAKECAYLRELDVLILEWNASQVDFDRAGITGEHFLEILKAERLKERDRLQEVLEKKGFARELEDLKDKIIKGIRTDDALYNDVDALVSATISTWYDEVREEYNAIDTNDLKVIHALRIRAKKLRYVMEVFELSSQEDRKGMHQEIKQWQEILGNITDANRNADAVKEIQEKYPEADIEEELKIFHERQRKQAERLYREFFRDR